MPNAIDPALRLKAHGKLGELMVCHGRLIMLLARAEDTTPELVKQTAEKNLASLQEMLIALQTATEPEDVGLLDAYYGLMEDAVNAFPWDELPTLRAFAPDF